MSLFTLENTLALITLTSMEIVLGIDNIIFISILVSKLPKEKQEFARRIGMGLAMLMRIGLLFSISWVMQLTEPWFTVFGHEFTGRNFILLGGGLFLIAKATHEIHEKMEESEREEMERKRVPSLSSALVQIAILDIVFSFDSVITAVGMAEEVKIMVIAIVVAVLVMLVFAKTVGDFVDRHPTIKILALSFLVLIGVMLIAEGFGKHVEKGYIYFAMGFSFAVELVNMRVRKPDNATESRNVT